MTDPAVEAADTILRRHAIPYVVVGGQAIALKAATATRDVDVMVTTVKFREAIDELGKDSALTLALQGEAVTRFGIVALHGAPLDVVDAGFFSGKKTAEEFFDFLVRESSSEIDRIRYVSPEAVWYTRLLTNRWKTYSEKIVTNVIDGIEVGRLDQVLGIARRFGTDSIILARIAYVRQELDRPEVGRLVPKD